MDNKEFMSVMLMGWAENWSAEELRQRLTQTKAKAVGHDYQPQCAALTEDGQQCRNSARGVSRYCASHKGYQPPTAKGLAQRF